MSGTDGGGADGDGGERPPGDGVETDEPHDSLLAALHVGQHARVGLAVGIGLAAVLYVPRYPVLDTTIEGARGYYLGLAFVLAATTAAVITAALSVKTFLEPVLDRSAWLRRGGVLCVLGGLGWVSTPILAELADSGTVAPLLWRNATSLATVALLIGTIGLHCAVTPALAARGGWLRRIERGAYWLAIVGLLIAAANATGNAAPTTTAGGETVVTPFLIGVLLAALAAVAFAESAERSGQLSQWRIRPLQLGGLLATAGIVWLVPFGGADWLAWSDAPAASVGLAATLVPAGLGWAIAGVWLWTAARGEDGAAGTDTATTGNGTAATGGETPDPGSDDGAAPTEARSSPESTAESGDE